MGWGRAGGWQRLACSLTPVIFQQKVILSTNIPDDTVLCFKSRCMLTGWIGACEAMWTGQTLCNILFNCCVQICVHWLKQCFWNYLDWTDIAQYLSVVMVMGVDYQVYICVAVLKHLRQLIVQHHQTQDLVVFLKVSLQLLWWACASVWFDLISLFGSCEVCKNVCFVNSEFKDWWIVLVIILLGVLTLE